MKKIVSLLLNEDRGATAIEYGLIASLIAVVIIASVAALGNNLSQLFTFLWEFFGFYAES